MVPSPIALSMGGTTQQEERDGEGSIISDEVNSRHSSIRGPYRAKEGSKVASFGTYYLSSAVRGRSQCYIRSLMFAGHGHSPWEPVGTEDRTKEHLRDGVGIGDIGVLTENGGEFELYYNIFCEEDDPIQRKGTPAKFKPLRPPLDASEIQFTPAFFPPGTILSSTGIEMNRISEEPLEVLFASSAREGGVLMLEDGADRYDLASADHVRAYLKEHAVDIYRYMNNFEYHRVLVPNGCLYVITGCDKAKAYCVAFCPDQPKNSGKPAFLSYKDGDWDEKDGFASNRSDERPDVAQASVFLRGIRVALSESLWAKHLPMVPQDQLPWSTILTTPILGFRSRIIARLHWRRKPGSGPLFGGLQLNFHPSSILLELLLLTMPNAEMAMVEDSVWQSVADGSPGTLPEIKRLIKEILRTHKIHMEDGVVRLLPNSPEENQRDPPTITSKLLAFITGKKKTPEEIAFSKLRGFFSSRLCKPS